KFVQIPYKGDMSMYILLPDERDGLQQLVEGWKKDELKDMIKHMNYTLMNLMLPKFEFDYEIDLLKTFEKMGVDIKPVWSSIHPTLYVSQALHKAKIKVHEAGTEAAAVTVLLFETFSAQRPVYPMELKVDRPFVFVIRDDISNVNLFVGTVNML
ncbi:antichymotrypsin-2-like isoform X6, partial [Leptotrombidium deliense]